MKRPSERVLLAVLLLLASPIFGAGPTLRAGFIISTLPQETFPPQEVNLDDLPEQTSLLAHCEPAAAVPQPVDRHSADQAAGFDRPETTGFSDQSSRNLPLPQDQSPWPVNDPPQDTDSDQGMGGNGAGGGLGSGSQQAGLPSTPVVTGPELAMRLFATEASFQVEDLARRFFRPPRMG